MDEQHHLKVKNKRLGLVVLAVVAGMIGMAYASVPLYNLFCRVTGFGGTTQVSETAPGPADVLGRTITVSFAASTARNMPWHFSPDDRAVTVPLGKKMLTSFRAENPTAEAVTGTALYNVTPERAGKYFHKIQCFCFGEQTLPPYESVSMPVVFYVDPEMDEDRNMDDVTHITLSYTFFRTESSDLDKALEGFYNQVSAQAEE